MECKHGAFLEMDGGRKCLLCGAVFATQEAQKPAKNAVEDEKAIKSQPKKRTAKKAE